MINRIPFSTYDFFGYLSAGLIYVLGYIYLRTTDIIEITSNNGDINIEYFEVDLTTGALLLILSFIIGHIGALPAKLILEGPFHFINWQPYNTLLYKKDERIRISLWWPFTKFLRPFPEKVQALISAQIKEDECEGLNGRVLSDIIYVKLKHHEITLSRLAYFLNTYTFCRNMSFAFLIISLMAYFSSAEFHTEIFRISLILGAGLFLRFLKFWHLFYFDQFIAYAYMPREK